MGSTVKPGFAAQAAKAALQQPPARPAVATGVRELELGSGASVSSSSVLSVLLGVPRTATAPALPGLAAAPVLACAAAFALAPFALAAGDVLSRSPVLEPGLDGLLVRQPWMMELTLPAQTLRDLPCSSASSKLWLWALAWDLSQGLPSAEPSP